MVGPGETLGSPWIPLGMRTWAEQPSKDNSIVRNFPCQTLKISKVSIVVMGS
jgi:hypothetical protein